MTSWSWTFVVPSLQLIYLQFPGQASKLESTYYHGGAQNMVKSSLMSADKKSQHNNRFFSMSLMRRTHLC
eukprot:3348294-Amphidinium_carterae.1